MAKEKIELSWIPDDRYKAGGRWRKKHKREYFWFGDIKSESDREGKQRAIEAFIEFRAAVDLKLQATKPHQEDYRKAIELRQEMLQWLAVEEADEPATKERLLKEVAALEKEFAKPRPRPITATGVWIDPVTPDAVGSVSETITWLDRLDSLRAHQKWNRQNEVKGTTLDQHISEYVAKEQARAEAGQIRHRTFKAVRERTMFFQKWLRDNGHTEITARVCDLFHTHLVTRIGKHDMAEQYGANLLNAMKAVIAALWRLDICEQPKNLDTLSIQVTTKEIVPFSPKELQAVWDNATERTELYALLMLQCGMLPSDIAALLHSEYKNGVITRRRTKTGKQTTSGKGKNVPLVSWPLWKRTRTLLEAHMTKPGELLDEFGEPLMLANDEGRPLLTTKLKDDGKVGVNTNIDSAWDRLRETCNEAGTPIRTLEILRKTGACKLEESGAISKGQFDYGRYSQYFLGQAPQGLTEKRYAKPSQELFNVIVKWLGEQFGFPT